MPRATPRLRTLALHAVTVAVVLALVGPGALANVPAQSGDITEGTGPAAATTSSTDVSFDQNTRGNIFLANETVTIDIVSDAPRVVWTVTRYEGRRVANGTVAVDGEMTLTLPVERVGHYTLRAWTPGAEAVNATTTVAVLPADDFHNDDEFYGMSTHFFFGRNHDLMGIMEQAGVGTVRDEHTWWNVEQPPGTYDFSGRIRAGFMTSLREHGFDRLFILGYGHPQYTGAGKAMPTNDSTRAAFGNYTRAVLREYPNLEHVEVWNEPNIGGSTERPGGADPATYVRLLEATNETVTRTDPSVTVVGGATSRNQTNYAPIDRGFWRGVLAAGGAEHMDVMSIHPYREHPRGYATDVGWLRTLTRQHNDGEALPIWATELGWSTEVTGFDPVTPRTQAQYLVYAHVRLQDVGVERAYWYTFRDDVPPTNDNPQDRFGLVRHPQDRQMGPYTGKPSLLAYATMTRQLAGLDHVRNGSAPSGIASHTFGSDGQRVRVLWTERNTEPTEVTVQVDGPVSVTTMGRTHRLTPQDGEVYLTVGPDPVYLDGPVTGIREGAPVSISASDGAVTVGAEGASYTHALAGQSVTVAGGSERTVSLPDAYRPLRPAGADVSSTNGEQRILDTVSVDGQAVGLLTARARPDAISPTDGSTPTQTARPGSDATSTTDSTATPTTQSDGPTPTADGGDGGTPTDASGPGFGAGVAVLAALLGLVLLARRLP